MTGTSLSCPALVVSIAWADPNDPSIDDGGERQARGGPGVEVGGGKRAQGCQRVSSLGERECGARSLGVLQGPDGDAAAADAAVRDGRMEKSAGERRGKQILDAHGAGGLAGDGHARRISTETADVVLDPMQCGNLVHETVIARGVVFGFGGQFGMGKESEGAHAVVERDDDHAGAGKGLSIVDRTVTGATGEPAAIDVNEDGKMRGRGWLRRPDVQKQAVFAGGRDVHVFAGPGTEGGVGSLHAGCAKMIGLEDIPPRRNRLRSAPAQRSDRRRGERNSFIAGDGAAGARDSGNLARLGGDDRAGVIRRETLNREAKQNECGKALLHGFSRLPAEAAGTGNQNIGLEKSAMGQLRGTGPDASVVARRIEERCGLKHPSWAEAQTQRRLWHNGSRALAKLRSSSGVSRRLRRRPARECAAAAR